MALSIDNQWLARAAAIPADERARMLANPDPTPSTTVDPELAEAMGNLRRAVERCGRMEYAMSFALRAERWRAVHQLRRLGCSAQVALECELERLEMLVGAGRKK